MWGGLFPQWRPRAHGPSSCPTGRRQPGRLLQVSPCLEPAPCQGPALTARLSSPASGLHTPACLGPQEGERWVPQVTSSCRPQVHNDGDDPARHLGGDRPQGHVLPWRAKTSGGRTRLDPISPSWAPGLRRSWDTASTGGTRPDGLLCPHLWAAGHCLLPLDSALCHLKFAINMNPFSNQKTGN